MKIFSVQFFNVFCLWFSISEKLFLTLYKELYYRHIYAKLKVINLFSILLNLIKVAPRLTHPFNLVVKSKLSSPSGSAVLRQLNTFHRSFLLLLLLLSAFMLLGCFMEVVKDY